ncbi:magnesium transporter [Roseisolibacter sp. H3M3-2]|uniref:magnesium transporter n=1 Tax=Roseisolibacter sp. H3M3-2 TaxID=3031323 RepID=UPI0023DC1CFA|nr:magnesium transporter [Roseisolibacter sp. H3M3-2]MDF1502929.1 magnesium transporter [Roseisolibacter sp. H3M3-2]
MTPPHPSDDGTDRAHGVAALLAPDILVMLDEEPGSVALETEELHPADLADVAEALPRERVSDLLRALPAARAADVLEHLDDELRSEVLEAMSTRQAAEIVTQMTPDERADVLEALAEENEERAEEILEQIPLEAREETERLLAYEPYSAGGLMTTEFVSVPEALTVEEALRRVRAMARAERREAMYTVYTTDDQGRLRGVLSLRELLAAPEGARLVDLAWSDVVTVTASAEQEEVARVTSNYGFVAVPVVDDQHRLLGVVTIDDVIDVIQEEQTEDVQKLGGMEALDDPYMSVGLPAIIRKRVGWLCVLFAGSLLTATVIERYEGRLGRAELLTLFIPLIVSSGGNSGSQATSLIIRAMALNEISLKDWWRVAGRELLSGLALGAVLGTLGLARVLVWHAMGWYDYGQYHTRVAATIGATLLGVVTFGSLAGSMLPFVLRRAGFDPASASAPFVATLVDVTGLLIYFSVAIAVLSGTVL